MRHVASAGTDPVTAVAAAASALCMLYIFVFVFDLSCFFYLFFEKNHRFKDGPLHGGANEAALRMLKRIGTPENVPAFVEKVKNKVFFLKKKLLLGYRHYYNYFNHYCYYYCYF